MFEEQKDNVVAAFSPDDANDNFQDLVSEEREKILREVEQEEDDGDIFAGEYEEFIEKTYYGEKNYESNIITTEDFSSLIKPRRTQLFKVIITRPKKEFEAPIIFNDKAPGEESSGANFDIKPVRTNEYPINDRIVMEIGLQTSNESSEKGYQVPKVRVTNSFTQVEPGMKDIIDKYEFRAQAYLNNQNKLTEIENFLHKIRSRVEEALQSNETIDIFQNDFDLDRTTQLQTDSDKKIEKQVEMRTFRDNLAAGQKSKKEKSVNCIRFIKNDEVYLAHSLLRNLSFEDRTQVIGIPYQSQILFWNFKDHEINSPVFLLDIPMEINCFEFCPTNTDKLVCGMFSGQLIIFELNDLMGILQKSSDSDYISAHKKRKINYNIF